MKKTLIALAAVAAATTASAELTIGGNFGWGYQSYTNNGTLVTGVAADVNGEVVDACAAADTDCVTLRSAGTARNSGFGMDTASITISGSEDLGNGLKLSASMVAAGMARGSSVVGEDYKMTLSGGFGSLLLGSIEIGSGIRGLAQAGAPVNNMEGEVLAAAGNADIVKLTLPAMNGFTLSAGYTEAVGLTTGADTTTKGSSAVTVGVDYAAGPLKAKFDYSDYNKLQASGSTDSRYRVAVQYNLGFMTVGAGFEDQDLVGNTTREYTMLGASMPVNAALTVGVVYAKMDKSATAGEQAGYSVGASYALSKRTSLTADYSKWDAAEQVSGSSSKKTTVLLNTSF